jgi:MFS family permease
VASVLSYPRLRRIVVAYTVNRLGSWIGLVALSLAVYDHTEHAHGLSGGIGTRTALSVAALLFAWQALPAFVVPAVVARVEASSRRHELSGLYLFEAVVTAAIALLLSHFSLPAVLLLAALDGTAALAASALLRAEIARSGREHAETAGARITVEEAERNANAVLNIAFSAAFIGGPVLGGIVTAVFGAPAALLVDVASFAICTALLHDLHPHVEEAGGDSVRARLSAAWRHVNEVSTLRALLATEAFALLFIQSAGPIEVLYAKGTLRAGDRGYGLLVTAWGAGAVLGSALFARAARRSLGAILSAGTFALGVAFLGYALAPSLAFGCLAAAVGGVGNTLEWPALISLVQRLTPQPLHGRLMGAVESLSSLCIAVGLMLGGALVSLSSPRTAFLVVGLGTALASVGFVRLTLGGLRAHMPALTAAPPARDAPTPRGAADAPAHAPEENAAPAGETTVA